jgi:hypothetical protein
MPTRLLLPIALLQGLWVRQSVPRLPPARGRRGRYGAGAARRVDRGHRRFDHRGGRRGSAGAGPPRPPRPASARADGRARAVAGLRRERRRFRDDPGAHRSARAGRGSLRAVRGRQRRRKGRVAGSIRAPGDGHGPRPARAFARGLDRLRRYSAARALSRAALAARSVARQAGSATAGVDPRTRASARRGVLRFPAGTARRRLRAGRLPSRGAACDTWAGWLVETWLSRPAGPAASAPGSASRPA